MTYFIRKQLVEDDVLFGVYATQKRCWITGVSARKCHAHEWLVPRSALPKRLQYKLWHQFNVALVDASVHDRHLTPAEELAVCNAKIALHGKQNIERWLASLELRSFGTLSEWIARREAAAAFALSAGSLSALK